jgi:arylsulfatase B/arylsulfatase I/J
MKHRILAAFCCLLVDSVDSKPHVFFVLVDDWGSYDVAWREKELGRTPQLHTPTLDALAKDETAIVLDQYYVQHICTPTRQSLMSGRYQIHTGLQDGIIQNSQKMCLPPVFKTMANAFDELGHETHMVGKWVSIATRLQ